MNKAFLSGNIATDPVLRGDDKKALNFRIATNTRVYNAETKDWESKADFFSCVMFGKRAEGIAKVLAKGQPVTLEASPRQNTWTGEDGTTRYETEFVVEDIELHRTAKASA